jgi:hypothetical protein
MQRTRRICGKAEFRIDVTNPIIDANEENDEVGLEVQHLLERLQVMLGAQSRHSCVYYFHVHRR